MVYLVAMNQSYSEKTTLIDAREMGEALDSIEIHAPEYAKAKAERIHLDDYRKVQLALLYEHAEGRTVVEKESWCKAHAQYREVLTEHANAVERETALYWKLKLAETQIEVWRTIQASRRREAQIL
jgi:hypothetical protein